jgi:hypothetical protein
MTAENDREPMSAADWRMMAELAEAKAAQLVHSLGPAPDHIIAAADLLRAADVFQGWADILDDQRAREAKP